MDGAGDPVVIAAVFLHVGHGHFKAVQRADIGFVEDVEVEVDGGPAVEGVEGGLRVFAEQVGILFVIVRRSAMDRGVILRPDRQFVPAHVC